MRASVWISALVGLVATAGIAGTLASQGVRVRVVAGDPERPVLGALLTLQTSSGQRVAQTLTDEAGRAVLQPPGPGSYRIRADRIGYGGTVTDPFTVADGAPASIVVMMPDTRVLLPELTVRSARRACRLDNESGTALATVWDEARKALTGTRLTRSVQPPELDVTTFEQELDRRQRVTGERSRTERRRVTAPFVTPDPARLVERGFVEERDGDLWFSAPDADLLLSDEFLEVHCFWIARGERPDTGLVGLAFEPAGGRRVPEVKGTLWLDRASAELRFLEFTYVNLDRRFATGGEGGRIAFQRLPAGGWIVSEWSIRTPIVARVRGRGLDGLPLERDSLLGHRETGGRATLVAAAASPTRAVVTGVVYDSTAGAPLAGAVVSIGGGAYADTTDSSGRFRIEAPNQGNFLVAAEHRTITLLGLGRLTGAALLARGAVANLDFGVPPLERIAAELCANGSIEAGGSAIVAGFVRDSAGALAAEATFDFLWRGPTPGPRQATLTSDRQGVYRLCGLAPDARIWFRSAGGLVPTPSSIRAADGPLTLTDITLVPAHRMAAPASITVVVRDSTHGTVVDGALLALLPAGDSTRTDPQGVGRFPTVRTGVTLIAVRALGYADVEREVEVAAGDTTLTIALPPTAVTLAEIKVSGRAAQVHPRMAAFEERRRDANGRFFTLDQLKPLDRSILSNVLRQAVGVRLVPRPSPCNGYAAASGRRGPAGGYLCQDAGFVSACYLAVYYNGSVFWRNGTGEPPPDIDQFRVDDLEGVEVYVGLAQVPASLNITGADCGVIALWPRVSAP